MSAHPSLAVTAPLSAGQRQLWALDQQGPSFVYNEPFALRIRGPLDPARLGRAFDDLLARHEGLRTRIVTGVDGEPVQVIDPPDSGFPLSRTDLRDHPDPERQVAELLRQDAWTVTDLATGPLTRARLVTLGPEHHVLIIILHHIMSDGWSRQIMLRDLGRLYIGPIAEPASPYREWVDRQHAWLTGPEQREQAAWWARNLHGAPPRLELPADRRRPAVPDHTGDQVTVALDAGLSAGLAGLAERCGATLYAVLLTGWAALLSRLSGTDDIVVGIPVANRRTPEVADVIGFVINTLAIRADLSGAPPVAEAVTRVSTRLRASLRRSTLPFERVVEAVNPPRHRGLAPIYQTMCGSMVTFDGWLELPGARVERIPAPWVSAKVDLTLTAEVVAGLITARLEYATALFDRVTVQRWAGYYVRLLTGMAAEPERPLADLPIMSPAEADTVLRTWGEGAPASPTGSVVGRIEEQTRVRPSAVAVVAGEDRLTYAGLDRRANRAAHALARLGVGPGDVVGIHAGRTADLVVMILGVLKAGAAWLPLDPTQPAARLAAMVADGRPALVVSDAPGVLDNAVAMAEVHAADVPETAPRVASGLDDLAYVIFTSGSTGRPKGVAVRHGGLLNLLDQWLARYPATPGEPASAWAAIGFDASVHELLLPLTMGAELHLVPEEIRRDPRELMAWLAAHRVVHGFLPPAYLRWIAEDPAERLRGLVLRQVHTGVESLTESALHRIRTALPGLEIRFTYGPTEATVYCTELDDFADVDRPCPIGRPLPGIRIRLLDERLHPVPPGVVGEIYLGGVSLARGYLNRPDLTAERFVADPYGRGERLYRTGDLARWLPGGLLSFAGRRDDQLKLRGFRIEPAEAEAALRTLPGVTGGVVLTDRTGTEPRLVAAVAGQAPPDWRHRLGEHVPDYMIPAVLLEYEALPLNASGKLDRAAVLERAGTATVTGGPVNTEAPRDQVEMALHRIWSGLLLHPRIGVSDSFFDVGGTSISAIRAAHEIEREFGERLPIREFIAHPTIEALGARIRRGRAAGTAGSLVELRADTGRGRVVCVHPAGGTAFCYLPLSTLLPQRAGVLGVQSPGLDPGEALLPSIEAMAEQYLRLVDARPGEPLVLCGLSLGGLIAYEMGRELVARGHDTVRVVLLDTQATDDAMMLAEPTTVDTAEFRAKLVRFNGMYPGIDDAQIERYHLVYNHNRTASRAYQPLPSAVPVVLIEATGKGRNPATSPFWQRRAGGGFRVVLAGCEHWDMLESDDLPLVARTLTAELAALTTAER
ncbi:non-ribosomal peptide synthetase [Dactylosporangium sp. CA-092794]|uniref:non-ribosomal peptide synthetase n=1 Tax=Dactylosporangium sp. CA-092794 TaxID=3239929 RepID=UPI003D8D2F15